jgi:DNA-binding beta-propeller fold protein YncE
MRCVRLAAVAAAMTLAVVRAPGGVSQAQSNLPLPEPYRLVDGWPTLPESMNGGKWGELIRVSIDPKGDIWVFHRCFGVEPAGSATCIGRDNDPPILKFDPSGKLLTSFGKAMFAFPHGFTIDHEGNIWASDANARETVLGMSTQGRGQQVFKFSPTGRVLMTLGKAGVAGNGPDVFDQPTGVVVARNGDVFVTDGHGRNNRVVKFAKDGRFIKAWGRTGSGPGELNQPHDIAMDSRGRLFVADRSNNRLSIFDQDGNFLDAWTQFGRPSAVFIGKDDTIYVSDSYSNETLNPGRKRGIYVGSARDGKVTAFIPDPDAARQEELTISGASGIAADDKGTVYAADVGPHKLRKYVLDRR